MYSIIFARKTAGFDPSKTKCLFSVRDGELSDPNYRLNCLYENEKGNLFLGYIIGYEVINADYAIGLQDIMPLTEEEAKEWVREWYYDDVSSASYQDSGALKKFGYGQKDSKGSCKE